MIKDAMTIFMEALEPSIGEDGAVTKEGIEDALAAIEKEYDNLPDDGIKFPLEMTFVDDDGNEYTETIEEE